MFGLYREDGEGAARSALQEMDLSWLGAGDSVFVKLACNSGEVHPATTSPGAVRATVEALFAAGAGRVLVGDQAGVEHVRLATGDQRFGSTRELMEENGLLDAIEESGAEPHFFDEATFDGGYFEGTAPADTYWTEPIFLPNIVKEVDHIVYLPRLSSHILAGYTHGHKNAMGWIRDDSRFHVHHKGEFFHEKYVDINYCTELASRHRLTLTVAESILLHAGPDKGTIVNLDPTVVVASPHLANHDAVSVAALLHFDGLNKSSGDGTPYGQQASVMNYLFVNVVRGMTDIPWGQGAMGYTSYTPHKFQRGFKADRALRRAYDLGGGQPEAVPVLLHGEIPEDELFAQLVEYSDRVLDFGG